MKHSPHNQQWLLLGVALLVILVAVAATAFIPGDFEDWPMVENRLHDKHPGGWYHAYDLPHGKSERIIH